MVEEGATPAFSGGSKTASSSGPAKTFDQIKSLLSEDLVKSIGGVFQFNLSGMIGSMNWIFNIQGSMVA